MKKKSIKNEDYRKYYRQLILKKIGVSGQKKIFNSKVLVIGSGGLGCPLILYLASKCLNFDPYQTSAVVLQAGTPTAISTILMSESYRINQEIAAKLLFSTTLISIITIPILTFLINTDY